jgi:Secretion system C-terminal sorting domain
MKEKLFLNGFLLLTTICFSQTTAIPDTNFEQALINQGIDTNGLTGDILNTDAAPLTSLLVGSSGISDLTGIEAFTSLTFLNCGDNSLTSLDLSANTLLTTVSCNDNLLTSLNVSANTALFNLDCRVNQLASIDVTNNVNLGLLNAGYNPLSNLDVTQNPALINLVIEANINMSSLDVTQNTALEFLNIQFVSFGSIDVTQNVALEQLFCQSSGLTSLDVSQNLALWNLDARGNQLVSLDLSNNPAMFIMILSNNLLTSLNVQNGNNNAVPNSNFSTLNNPNLNCITVDDASYSSSTWTNIDVQTNFSDNCSLSINILNATSLKVFPNPTINIVNVSLNLEAKFSLMNVFGKAVQKGFLKKGNTILNVTLLSTGLYFLNVQTSSGSTTKKIIRQ